MILGVQAVRTRLYGCHFLYHMVRCDISRQPMDLLHGLIDGLEMIKGLGEQ
jgi:hypothetical protein